MTHTIKEELLVSAQTNFKLNLYIVVIYLFYQLPQNIVTPPSFSFTQMEYLSTNNLGFQEKYTRLTFL